MTPQEALNAARNAVKALMEEYFITELHGYGEQERELYHKEHVKALLQALNITESLCVACGSWYPSDSSCGCEEI